MTISVVMRARNDMPLIRDTVSHLLRQSIPLRLIAFDNGSTDGTRELLLANAERVIDVPPGDYVPGRVLNNGMRETNSDIVVFLNSDCTPVDDEAISRLIEPFNDSRVAASFGRQVPRQDCTPLAAKDIELTYGDGNRQERWRHCFSMASSAVRRSAWQRIPFDESVQYSEDIDWSFRLRQAGYAVAYAAESRVYHSHNYSPDQWSMRQFGEGKAEATIFPWNRWQRSFLRYSLLPFLRQIVSDGVYCVRRRQWKAIWAIPGYRHAQMTGRRAGFLAGLRNLQR